MPRQTVIDLSLSTDDESSLVYANPIKPATSKRAGSGYGSLSEQFPDNDGGPLKKRKLSPPIPTAKGTFSIGTRSGLTGCVSDITVLKANDDFVSIGDDDPIVWTSSPKGKRPSQKDRPYSDKQGWASLSASDSDLPDEQSLHTAQQRPAQDTKRWHGTLNSNCDKHELNKKRLSSRRKRRTSPNAGVGSQAEASEDDESTKQSRGPAAGKYRLTEEEKAVRAREKEKAREVAKAVKERKKEEDKERRRLLKEGQAREKQIERDRAEANRLKLDKKLSTPEMIVDLPVSIDGSTIDTQIREFLKQIGVEVTSYQSPIANLIKWRRKVDSRFDAETGCREKLPSKEIHAEKHVMCLMSANELADLLASETENDGRGLDEHVARIKSTFKDCIPVYMIEGVDAWIRKNRNARNRAYTAAVLGKATSSDQDRTSRGVAATSKAKKQRLDVVDEDMIEDAMLRLQVVHNCLVHHAAVPVEIAEWAVHFTEQISQIPYRYVILLASVHSMHSQNLGKENSLGRQLSAWTQDKSRVARTPKKYTSICF